MKYILLLILKLALLTVVFAILLLVGSFVFVRPAMSTASVDPAQAGPILLSYLVMALVDTLVIALIILRSRWSGWRLMLATVFSIYGVMTFMPQIETAWFGPAMTTMNVTPALLRGLFLQTVPLLIIFVPLAVWLLGKARATETDTAPAAPLPHSVGDWAWRLVLVILAYLVLYFSFGFVVAWQNPAVRDLYDAGANQDVFAFGRLVPFQMLRALLWLLFALPVIRMTRGPLWQVAIVVGLLVALPMNMFLVQPSALMSASVRLSHFVETTTSNFIFGVIMTYLMLWRPGWATKEGNEELRPAQ
ncbi:MAG: hypothetical protein U0822_26995 [Anaerolineae bacterium]